jgi:hypothetical protein
LRRESAGRIVFVPAEKIDARRAAHEQIEQRVVEADAVACGMAQ